MIIQQIVENDMWVFSWILLVMIVLIDFSPFAI